MCGIFGYVSWRRPLPPTELLGRVTNLLRHRGPDGGGYWADESVYLGHRRLAIIDLEQGAQPMFSHDGRLVIVFNGEIYNYLELREELRACGHVFYSNSDTEVILAGYRAWGAGLASRLVGMFAFVIYDRWTRTAWMARDRFGEKPLLFVDHDGSMLFASELAPLSALLESREIDPEALGGYLCLNYVPGRHTMMKGVQRLEPGTWRTYDASGLREEHRYWTPTQVAPGAQARDLNTAADDLQERIDRALAITLRSDVPVGLFLSGGIDSSVVAESAVRQGKLAQAFCLDMGETGFSEWPGASYVARKLGLELKRVEFAGDVLDQFLTVVSHADDPLADSSALAVWAISQAAARHVKVVLGGDGGDELFAGYLTYQASERHAVVSSVLPPVLRRAIAALAQRCPVNDRDKVSLSYKAQRFFRACDLPTAEAHFTWNGTWLPAQAATFVVDERHKGFARRALATLAAIHGLGERPTLHQLQCADLSEYLPNDILTKVDRMTMAHGLESRAPFLNPDIVDLALGLPASLRIDRRYGPKAVLRVLCERHFGPEHARAPKQGFSIPIHRWLRAHGRPLVEGLLAPERLETMPFLDAARVGIAIDRHMRGRAALGWEIWGLMVLSAWHEVRIVNPPRPSTLPRADDLQPVSPPS